MHLRNGSASDPRGGSPLSLSDPSGPPAAAASTGPPPPPGASDVPPAAVQLDDEILRRRTRAYQSVLDLIGGTPLVRLAKMEPPGVEIWAKCEFANPGGSVKDRPALQMLRDAIADGRLTPDRTIIDATSGNTGVAYSLVGAALGYRVKLVMPANVSAARKQITSAYGTELVFSSEMEGSDGAIRVVREIVAAAPERYFYPDQYSNESNPRAHYLGTGPEILALLGDRITHFVAGIGTSGTVMGTGRRMKEHRRPDGGAVTVVAVEPDDAFHGLEGLKHMASSIVPAIWRPTECVDRILPMPTEEGWEVTDHMRDLEGLFVGHSAGANVAGALRIARELAARGETGCIVTVLCDRGDRYFVPLQWERRYEL
ncbi:MAG: pyridoxal-phosphate dependent enzyme [Polyangia bacterium]